MRTAVTIAKRHSGEEVLIAGHDVPLLQQREAFRKLRGVRIDNEFQSVSYQESDGPVISIRFVSDKEAKAELAKTEAENKRQAEATEKAKRDAETKDRLAKEEKQKELRQAEKANSKPLIERK